MQEKSHIAILENSWKFESNQICPQYFFIESPTKGQTTQGQTTKGQKRDKG